MPFLLKKKKGNVAFICTLEKKSKVLGYVNTKHCMKKLSLVYNPLQKDKDAS